MLGAEKGKGSLRKQVAPALILKIAATGLNKNAKDEEKRKKEVRY